MDSSTPAIEFDPRVARRAGYTMKEGLTFRTNVRFYVQREIVTGLRYISHVKRMGVRVYEANEVMGSFAPRMEPYEHLLPEEEVPSGFLGRGSYTAKTKLIDDDGNIHCEIDHSFEVIK